jgi:hypothetical protein
MKMILIIIFAFAGGKAARQTTIHKALSSEDAQRNVTLARWLRIRRSIMEKQLKLAQHCWLELKMLRFSSTITVGLL